MKIVRHGMLFCVIAVLGAITACRPAWLSENGFLRNFASSEVIVVLVVIPTITFASVANMHLSLDRLGKRVNATHARTINQIGDEINSNAWLLFRAFIVCVIALIARGWAPENMHLVAAVHAIILIVLLINVLVMHTLFRSVLAMASAENTANDSTE